MVPVFSLIIILVLSILITRIATIAIMQTGLSRQSAKFQSRSAFTGVGFTTTEAENVTKHPVRRKIVMLLMLLGNAGIVSAIASLMLTFVNRGQDNIPWYWSLSIILLAITILWVLTSSKLVDRWLNRVIERALNKYTDLNIRDYSKLLKLTGDYQISEMKVAEDDWIANHTLAESALRQEGITVLGIERQDGTYLGVPDGDTKIVESDILIIYGRESSVIKLDERRKGRRGHIEHKKAESEQEQEKQRQRELERESEKEVKKKK
ncbi:MAG: hypothetical protein K9G67_07425 [Bacteroidales bacterium]|nr:hypothetical protein [Bacteroidales bacterium]MCF8343627.1 hypothetical protein [Bacteroidales bacterium]MCF8350113.1 hypothetical protein [Bacteroidales bacterium]MCF8376171.1 hypothetical protein [Bacteroidales bacterium]MCF8402261.1 hypothetical protein [Bacteroidales bacterium]